MQNILDQHSAVHQDAVITVRLPFTIKRRGGGHRMILAPAMEQGGQFIKQEHDQTLLKALIKAHFWKQQLERGERDSIEDIGRIYKVNASYVRKLLRLSYLAPDITAAILRGNQPRGLKLADLMRGIPEVWEAQREKYGFGGKKEGL